MFGNWKGRFAGMSGVGLGGARCSVGLPTVLPGRLLLGLLGLWVVASFSLRAQVPLPRLHQVFPLGGAAGTTVEVECVGADLDGAHSILCSVPGIRGERLGTNSPAGGPVRFRLTVPKEAPRGFCELWVAGRYGVSNPRVFLVDDLPSQSEKDPNDRVNEAQAVPLDSAVDGRCDAAGFDCFEVRLAAGQRLSAACQGVAMDSRVEPWLELLDGETGRTLATGGASGTAVYLAASPMRLVVRVRDLLYRGGPEYGYRLALTSMPWVESVFPPVREGSGPRVTLLRSGAPGKQGGDAQAIAWGAGSEWGQGSSPLMPWMMPGGGLGLPWVGSGVVKGLGEERFSNPVLVASGGGEAEVEPNDSGDKALKVAVPADVWGRFFPANDSDWFEFQGAKGEVLWVEVYSHRLGFATDPVCVVQRGVAGGGAGVVVWKDLVEVPDLEANVGGPELNTASRDPGGRVELPESGVYRVLVRDAFGRVKANPRHLYRLTIAKPVPDFSLVSVCPGPVPTNPDSREVPISTPTLRRGETMPVKVMLMRRQGMEQPVDVVAEGLPVGVKGSTLRLEGGRTSGVLLLTASMDAGVWDSGFRLVGRAAMPGGELVRTSAVATVVWPVGNANEEVVRARGSTRMVGGVVTTETALVRLKPLPQSEWVQESSNVWRIPIQVARAEGSTESFKVKVQGIPALDALPELEVPANTNVCYLTVDWKAAKMAPGVHHGFLRGHAKGKYRREPEGVTAAEGALKLKEEEIKLAAGVVKDLEAKGNDAEAAVAEAKKRLAELESQRPALQAKLKEATDKAQPKDVTFTLYSEPLVLTVPGS